jgi:exonuclease III
MKIITWNCNMAFRKKAEFILSENPDILIVPECEQPEKLTFKRPNPKPRDIFWFGENPNKGLGVFSFNDFKINPIPVHNEDFRYVVPLNIENSETKILLFAVWAQKPNNNDNYGIQVWNAINHYKNLLQYDNVMLIGDFNSNTIWDLPNRVANHSNIVKFLDDNNINSAYHYYYNQKQGEEKNPTLYLQRKENKPYHIDYCFASKSFLKRLTDVRIGTYQDWIKYSDHTPLIINFEK